MAEPSQKTEALEDLIKGVFGYDRREVIRQGVCVPPPIGCGREGIEDEFRDVLSIREYTISGLCQRCQDLVFGSPEELRGTEIY